MKIFGVNLKLSNILSTSSFLSILAIGALSWNTCKAMDNKDYGSISISALDPLARGAASDAIGRTNSIYKAYNMEEGIELSNPTHNAKASFTSKRALFSIGNETLGFAFKKIGYEGDNNPPSEPANVAPTKNHNRVSYDRGAITEWYINGPAGFEQGFTLEKPLNPNKRGRLILSMSLSGTLSKKSIFRDSGVSFKDTDVTYGDLAAFDSRGKSLPISIYASNNGLDILVDERDAVYPITVDPFIAKPRFDNGGNSVSISSDGSLMAIGAPWQSISSNVKQGAIYVLKRTGSSWVQRDYITASDGAYNDQFGFSVSLSSDGNTLAVGAPMKVNYFTQNAGATYVYRYASGKWTENKVLPTDSSAGAQFGKVVMLTKDGQTLAVANALEKVYIYKFTNNFPNQTNSFSALGTGFGTSIAFSGDGKVLAVGAEKTNQVYVYKYNGSSWVYQNYVQDWSGSFWPAKFGHSVALNKDGTTMVIGLPGYGPKSLPAIGSVAVLRSGQPSYTLTPPQSVANLQYGNNVTVNSNGRIIAVGSFYSSWSQTYPVNGGTYIYDNLAFKTRLPQDGYNHLVSSLSISDDGYYIAHGESQETKYSPSYARTYPIALQPTITSVAPNSGPKSGGTLVTLSGNDYVPSAAVSVGGKIATSQVKSTSTIYAYTPNSAITGSADVVITNPNGESAKITGGFSYR